MWLFIAEFPFWLEGFTALSKLTVEIPTTRLPVKIVEYNGNVRTIMKRIKKKVGVRGRIVQVSLDESRSWSSNGYGLIGKQLWVFEAQNGALMDWSKGDGKVRPNPVGRWFKGYWDEVFFEDHSFRLGMENGQFVYLGMDDEFEE